LEVIASAMGLNPCIILLVQLTFCRKILIWIFLQKSKIPPGRFRHGNFIHTFGEIWCWVIWIYRNVIIHTLFLSLSFLDLFWASQEWVLKKSFLYFSTSIKYYYSGFLRRGTIYQSNVFRIFRSIEFLTSLFSKQIENQNTKK
jgi:hypothetical protein